MYFISVILLGSTIFFFSKRHAVIQFGHYQIHRGAGVHFALAFYLIALMAGLSSLVSAYKRSHGLLKNQIKLVFIALFVGVLIGLTNSSTHFNINKPQFGHLGVLAANAIITYAIVKHSLMNVEIVVQKSLIYSTLTAILAGSYMLLTFLSSEALERVTGWDSLWPAIATIALLAAIFDPLSKTIQNCSDKVFFRKEREYRSTIRQFSQTLLSILDFDKLMNTTTKKIKEILGICCTYVLLYDQDEERYKVASFIELDESLTKEIELDKQSALVRELQEKREIIYRKGVTEEYFCVAVPLFFKGDLIGILNLGQKLSGDIFSKEDLELLTILGNQLAIAITNARLYRLVVTDSLTKLYDAFHFELCVGEETRRSQHDRTPLSVVRLDIDSFKSFNKIHGTKIGELALTETGRILKENARFCDIPARIGGDEFSVILPGLTEEEAFYLATRIKSEIEVLKFRSKSAITDGFARLKISFGVASLVTSTETGEALLNRVNLSLCRQKAKNDYSFPASPVTWQ